MTIDKINPVQNFYGGEPMSKAKLKKPIQPSDSIKISSSAQERFNEKRISQATVNLSHYLVEGKIDTKVLDKVSTKIARELGYLAQ